MHHSSFFPPVIIPFIEAITSKRRDQAPCKGHCPREIRGEQKRSRNVHQTCAVAFDATPMAKHDHVPVEINHRGVEYASMNHFCSLFASKLLCFPEQHKAELLLSAARLGRLGTTTSSQIPFS